MSSISQDDVHPGDSWSLLFSAARTSPRSREMVWEFVKEKWAVLKERYKGSFLLSRTVEVRLLSQQADMHTLVPVLCICMP